MSLGGQIVRFTLIPLALAALATAQTATPPTSTSPAISARSTLVLVPALVRTKAGELVFTLTASDFAITDDGIEQKVTLEENTDDEPLALVVAIETGGAGAQKLDAYRHLETAIESVVGNVPHEIAVVGFDKKPKLFQDFTSNLDMVGGAIDGLSPGHGAGAILDALAFSVDLLRQRPPQYRRAILLISETIDHGSRVTMDEALRAISDTNTAIYSIAFSSPKSDARRYTSEELPTVRNGTTLTNPNPQHPGGCMAKDSNPDPGTSQSKLSQGYDCLGQLLPPLAVVKVAMIAAMEGMRQNAPETVAHLTGGEYFPFSNIHNLESSLLSVSNHIPNRYVLSFQPPSPHPGLHSIEVRLRERPKLVVTARRSYWADNSEAVGEPTPSPHP
jgi:VWFA-related protein